LRDLEEEADPFLINYRGYEQDYGDSVDANMYYKKLGNKYRQMYLNM
jgi:hypothetical protein